MAKLFKIQAYIVDPNGEFRDSSYLEDCLIGDTQNHFNLSHLRVAEIDLGEWDDNHPLNYVKCPESEFKKYFPEKCL